MLGLEPRQGTGGGGPDFGVRYFARVCAIGLLLELQVLQVRLQAYPPAEAVHILQGLQVTGLDSRTQPAVAKCHGISGSCRHLLPACPR